MSAADFEQVIQWYPGHMAASMRRIESQMKLVDVVIEVVDARVPASGSNPMLDAVAGTRKRLLILTRADLADPQLTAAWIDMFGKHRATIAVDARERGSLVKARLHMGKYAGAARGTQRAMVVGLPNSGKSSVINGLLRRTAAKTEDRAGVTRSLTWFRLEPQLELMDTPGILVPKIASAAAQWKLALVGAVPRDRFDPEDVANRFYAWIVAKRGKTSVPGLAEFAAARGFKRRGGEPAMHNAALSYIKDFNDGKFGRISLETPHE